MIWRLKSAPSIEPNLNKEDHVEKAFERLGKVLKDKTTVFRNKRASTDEILEAAEYCVNLLEAAKMVPMYEPPTAKIQTWRSMLEQDRDAEAIRTFAYELGLTLKKYCRIY